MDDNGVSTVQVGGTTYSTVAVSTCRTCASTHRTRIETMLLRGRPASAVIVDLPQGHGLTSRNLRDHVANGHLPADAPQVQQALDQHHRERAEIATEAAEVAADHISFARGVLGAVSNRMADGTVAPTVRDGIGAAALLGRWQESTAVTDGIPEEDVVAVMDAWMDAAKRVMNRDAMSRFGRLLDADPRLAALDEARS